MMDSFEIKWYLNREFPVILLEGDITGETSVKIRAAFDKIKSEKRTYSMIFDFTNSKYINSSGISIFIQLLQEYQAHNGQFIFTGLSDHLNKVIHIVGISGFITIYDTVDSAIILSKNQ